MNISSINSSIALLTRLCDCRNATVPIIEWKSEKPRLVSSPVSSPLPRALPEETGVPSEVITAFLNDIKSDPTLNMHTILFVKNGSVIASAEFGEYDMSTPKYVFSASKSVTALAIGMLIDEGSLSLDEKLTDIFPEKCGAVTKLKLRDMTVETLLTMRSGVVFSELGSMTVTDWQDAFINSVIRGSMNKDFSYNSLNTYMLAAIIKRKTGKGLVEYLTPRLFEPLDIRNYFWEKSPEGIEKGGWGLYIRPEDFAKIGIMVHDGGVWNGKRLISERWLETAVTAHATPPAECGDFNYGYQIWCGRRGNTFLFNGMLGQNLLCMRSSGLIIVSNAGNDESFQQSNYFKYVLKHFGKAFDSPLPQNADAVKELNGLLYRLKHPQAQNREKAPDLLTRLFYGRRKNNVMNDFDGMIFKADDESAPSAALMPVMLQGIENNYSEGFEAFGVERDSEGEYTVTVTEKGENYRFKAGENRFIRTDLVFHGQYYLTASSVRAGKNEDGESVLTFDMLFLETPFSRRIKIILGDTPKMLFNERPGAIFSVITVNDVITDFAKTPVIGAVADLLSPDLWRGMIKGTFEKSIRVISEKIR